MNPHNYSMRQVEQLDLRRFYTTAVRAVAAVSVVGLFCLMVTA